MFDIGFFELCIIGVVALLVLGPERLPRAARTAGMWLGRAKRMVSQVKRDIDDELRQEELHELREVKDNLSKTGESMSSFKEELNQQVDTDGEGGKKKPASKAKAAGKPASGKGAAPGKEAASRTPSGSAPESGSTADTGADTRD